MDSVTIPIGANSQTRGGGGGGGGVSGDGECTASISWHCTPRECMTKQSARRSRVHDKADHAAK